MNQILDIGAVSLRANQRALEMMANNIANMNTPAFKRTDAVYAEVAGDPARTTTAAAAATPLATDILPGGVRVAERATVSAQGELRPSANTLDIAIEGRGFIQLMGAEGQTLLWRGGRLEVDENGNLAAAGHAPLRSQIAVPDDATALSIARNGIVSAKTAEGQVVELGQINLVRVDSDTALERTGAGLFVAREDSRITETAPGEDGSGALAQAMIERSNVDFSAAMVELLMIQRAYAASAQLVQAGDQLASISNNLKR